MKTNLKIMLTAVCLIVCLVAYGQDTKSDFNPIEHAVISQTIAPDARAAGMGDVGVATDPDVNSQYWRLIRPTILRCNAVVSRLRMIVCIL